MFYKSFMIFLAGVAFSSVSYANTQGECANYAKAAAIKAYIAMAGTVQGSEGIQYEIKQKLKAREPFHNYIVSITDNNEDGEVWTLDYFVMTKIENGKCRILKVREEI